MLGSSFGLRTSVSSYQLINGNSLTPRICTFNRSGGHITLQTVVCGEKDKNRVRRIHTLHSPCISSSGVEILSPHIRQSSVIVKSLVDHTEMSQDDLVRSCNFVWK